MAEVKTEIICELGLGAALSGFMKRIDKTATMLNVADTASLEVAAKA